MSELNFHGNYFLLVTFRRVSAVYLLFSFCFTLALIIWLLNKKLAKILLLLLLAIKYVNFS